MTKGCVSMKPEASSAKILAAGTVCLTVLCACSGSDDDGNSAEQPSESPSASTVDTTGVSPQDLPTPPAVRKATGAVSALKLDNCPVSPGNHKVTGTIKSEASSTADYLVVVNWSTDEGDVMGSGYTVLRNVKPAETRQLAITAKVADGAARCVPFVQYGDVKK